MKEKSLLGKALKASTYESKWHLIPESVKKISKETLRRIQSITVFEFTDKESGKSHLRAKVSVAEGYVTFRLDAKMKAVEGDAIDPSTFRFYQLTNGEVTIEASCGKIIASTNYDDVEEEEEIVAKPTKKVVKRTTKKVAKKSSKDDIEVPF